MKNYHFYLILILLVLGHCDNKTKKNNLSDLNKLSKDSIKVDALTKKDDGTWTAIIEGKLISKNKFEELYSFWLKMSSMTGGIGKAQQELLKDNIKNKKTMLDLLINIELAVLEAMNGPFFKSDKGKSLIKIYGKQALTQYYLLDKFWPKVKEPSDKELKAFFEKFIKPKSAIKEIKTKNDKNQITVYYRHTKLNELVNNELSRLVLERKVRDNKKVLLDYIKGKIKKELYMNNKENKYWILKIDDEAIYLKDISPFLDLQLKGSKFDSAKANEANLKMFSKEILNSFKMMELNYQNALKEKYFDKPEVKNFIKFFQKRSIADFFIKKEVLERVKKPTDKDIDEKLRDNSIKEKAIKLLGKKKIAINDKNIKKLVKEMIYAERLQTSNREIIDELKGSYKVKISKKYFETESDKIQEKILKNNKDNN